MFGYTLVKVKWSWSFKGEFFELVSENHQVIYLPEIIKIKNFNKDFKWIIQNLKIIDD